MIEVLIVDDDYLAVEGIKGIIDWKGLGVDRLACAYSKQQAMDILKEVAVDVVLCDVEMPQGSGIELAQWVRDERIRTEIIFLTCHADFKYVKSAISLHSHDYLLKPVDKAELEVAILGALAHRGRILEVDRTDSGGMSGVCEYFWMQAARGTITGNGPEYARIASGRGIPLEENNRLAVALIVIHGFDDAWEAGDKSAVTYAQINMAKELLVKDSRAGAVIEMDDVSVLAIRCPAENSDLEELRKDAQRLTDMFGQHLGIELCCYISGLIRISQLSEEYGRLVEMERENVYKTNGVVMRGDYPAGSRKQCLPNMELWESMLNSGRYSAVREEVIRYLSAPALADGMSAEYLRRFKYEMMRILYAVYEKKGRREQFFVLADMERMERSAQSVTDMLVCVGELLNGLESEPEDTAEDPVEIAKNYIMVNIDKEISREDIAKSVYLNPDYLSRIFKKKEGTSLIDYLIRCRMDKARQLLEKSDLTVSEVASSVGYNNFSHFSKLFRKRVGINPDAYRRLYRMGKNM